MLSSRGVRWFLVVALAAVVFWLDAASGWCQAALPVSPLVPTGSGAALSLNVGGLANLAGPSRIATSLQILAVMTVLSLAPALLMMMTSFVRIVVVLGFVRRAMGTQEVPPNQVILGLALFLTFFVMAPTMEQVNNEALQPYIAGQLLPAEAFQQGMEPIREFLFKQTRKSDLALFLRLGKVERPKTKDDIPSHILIPAFMISELKTAFIIGFIIYIPFLIIDMVVSSILLSMGMMMLPPVIISLPFKVLLFVLVDGWSLVVSSLMKSF